MDTTDQRLNSAGSNEILKDMQNLAENPNALLHPDGNYIYEQINEENVKEYISQRPTESSVEDALHSIQLQHQAFK